MATVETLKAFEQIKLLSDSRRLEILRRLMAGPATLTHLGQALGEHPAWVRHHIKKLEEAGLVEIAEIKVTSGVTEKFYRAHAGAFLIQEMVLPQETDRPTIIFSGSHDLAVERLAGQLSAYINLLTLPIGSLDGLVALRQGFCHLSGCHLLDADGEYNTPFVRHLFPDRATTLVTLAYRTQGLMLAAGNPKEIKSVADLAQPNVHFVNRNAGSGTRLWFDSELKRLGISSAQIKGHDRVVVSTHSEAASLIETGKADVSIGLQAAARQHGLAFIPLFEERYDLVLPLEQEHALAPLLDYIQTTSFRDDLNALTGYNSTHSGEHVTV